MIGKLLSYIPGGLPVMFSICLALGVAGALAWEHRSPWGLGQKHHAALIELGKVREQRDAWKQNRDGWHAHAKRLEGDRERANDDQAAQVDSCSEDRSAALRRAYDNGHLAGRAAAARFCGASNETSSLPAAGADGGLVRNPGPTLADVWRDGAYRPPGAVPANR